MVQLVDDPFGENEFIVTADHVALFYKGMQEEFSANSHLYHPKDVETIKTNYEICRRYVRHKKCDLNAALEMAKKSLQWRNEFGVNDLTEHNIYRLYLNVGCFIPLKKDKNGSQCIVFRARLHRKCEARAVDMRRYLVFWIEKFLYVDKAPRITLIFDSTNASYASMDIDQVTFSIQIFNELYPWALGHVIVYNMPWFLKTVWAGLRQLIPSDGLERFVFCTGNEIFERVDPDCLPEYMGGTVALPYRELTPEEIDAVPTDPDIEQRICTTPAIEKFYRDHFGLFKEAKRANGQLKKFSIFTCTPDTHLVFETTGEDQKSSFSLENSSPDGRKIVFKIKGNSLQGYKVRPFCGVLNQGESVRIEIKKSKAYPVGAHDKFMVLAVAVDSAPEENQIAGYWRTIEPDQLFTHKLRCISGDNLTATELDSIRDQIVASDSILCTSERPMTGRSAPATSLANTVNNLSTKVSQLMLQSQRQRWLIALLFMLIILNIAVTLHGNLCNSAANRRRQTGSDLLSRDPLPWYC